MLGVSFARIGKQRKTRYIVLNGGYMTTKLASKCTEPTTLTMKVVGVVGLERTESPVLPADHPWLSAGAQSLLARGEARALARRAARLAAQTSPSKR